MKFFGIARSIELRIEAIVAVAVLGALGACGSSSSSPGPSYETSSSSGGSTSGSSSGGVDTNTSSSGTGDDTSSSSGGGDASGGDGGTSSNDGAAISVPAPGPSTCPSKGQVTPSQVIVLGDSYLDHPFWSNAIPDLYTDLRNTGSLGASATYREYQIGGASMNYGALNLNIPYQYETSAMMDSTVINPTDIDTVIIDGGGNDVIIDNRDCLTDANPPPADATCATAIQGTVTRAQQLFQEMAGNHVKHIVYVFYPHLSTAGGGLLPTPSPQVNAVLDYAAGLAEQVCCGATFMSTISANTCNGNVNGAECVFVDIRPAFEGHIADYIKIDNVHPTDDGAQVIGNLLASAMGRYCIAQ